MAGEVLFWTLRQCLGDIIYDAEMHGLWVRLFSKVLSIMIPLAVRYELADGAGIERRFVISAIPLSDRENVALRQAEDYYSHGVQPSRSDDSVLPTVRIN